MTKLTWQPGTMLYPAPAVLVSCAMEGYRPNIITIAWAGTICSQPPMVSISVRPERYSHSIILESGEFALNLPTAQMAWSVDLCGVKSGRETDKWAKARLTQHPAVKISVPIISECPVNLECKVKSVTNLGSHDLFVAEVVAVDVTDSLVDENGRLRLGEANLLTYVHGEYWSMARPLGHFGFSVRKKPGATVRSTRAKAVADNKVGDVGKRKPKV